MTKRYYNLSQMHGDRMVYFRSTDIEQKNYHRLLWSVPDEWFYWMYAGHDIEVYDESSNGAGKVERIYIPVLEDVLGYVLLNISPQHKNLEYHFTKALEAISKDKQLETRIKFWKGKISRFSITAHTLKVERERNPLDVPKPSSGEGVLVQAA